MKFIHAVIFDIGEYKELREYGVDFTHWGDLTNGDYVVHCLYSIDDERIIIHEDNTHAPVEATIETFLEGVEFCGHDAIVTKAYIVVDNGLSYNTEAATLCLVEGNYVEVE